MEFSYYINNVKNQIWKACMGVGLTILVFTMWKPGTAYAAQSQADAAVVEKAAEQPMVSNLNELNEQMGGNHRIEGNTLVLQSDVSLKQRIRFAEGTYDIAVDLNGWTIRSEDYIFYFPKSRGTLVMKGNGACSTSGPDELIGGNPAMQIVLEGDIHYYSESAPKLFLDDINLMIKNGEFDAKRIIDSGALSDCESYNSVIIRGGVFNGEMCIGDGGGGRFEMTGGTINGVLSLGTKSARMSGGVVYGGVYHDAGTFRLSGGVIHDGLALTGFSRFTMTGGTIYAGDHDKAVLTVAHMYYRGSKRHPYARILGGTLIADREDTMGIDVASGRIALYGGKIVNRSGKGKYGIHLEYVESPLCWDPSDPVVKCYLKSANNSGTYIKGFTYGLYIKRHSGASTSCNHSAVRVFAPKNKPRNYYGKDRLPDQLAGNIKILSAF